MEIRTKKLGQLAQVIRSKNSGPFELTLDIMFADNGVYERVKASGVITPDRVASLYGISPQQVIAFVYFDAAKAIKVTVVRPKSSGAVGDSDIYGAQQHAPFLDLEVPWED